MTPITFTPRFLPSVFAHALVQPVARHGGGHVQPCLLCGMQHVLCSCNPRRSDEPLL